MPFFRRHNSTTYTLAVCALALLASVPARADNPTATVAIDTTQARHVIKPQIYGVAYATTAQLSDLNSPLNRQGGNPTSRYNWLQNADNRAADYFFESIGYSSATAGENGDTFISQSKAAGADSMLTIPLLPWIAKLGAGRAKLGSFSVAKYGPQQSTIPYMPDSGNGVHTDGSFATGNDPNDANVPSTATTQRAWMDHLVATWGLAANGGLKYYLMDNEASIWFSSHRDVQPVGATMAQFRDAVIAYAGQVKAADPGALVVGPEEWGWDGYFYSGYDQQYGAAHNYSSFPDRAANGNEDYYPWLLDQFKAYETAHGQRLLDVCSAHFYPQGGEFSDDVSTATQLLRNRSTRALWDPNYVNESWINDKVQLIPRLNSWVAGHYPGLQTALTEYNWGAEGNINGATTQADIDGIMGREGLDMATRWTTPATGSPVYNAMKLYRNYDGAKSTFGDTSVQATVANPDNLAAFAAQRASDGALTVMVINKYLTGNTPVHVTIAGFTGAGTAQVWQLTSANSITQLANATVAAGALDASVPAQSITLFVVAPTATYTVSGHIATAGGVATANVSVAMTGQTTPALTNATGDFSFSNIANGAYTLTPTLAGYTFNPTTLAATVAGANLAGRNFTAIPAATYTVTGRITNSAGVAIAGATVAVTGNTALSATTSSTGYYTVAGLPPGSHTLTPTLASYAFTPASKAVTITNANVTGQNFVGKTGLVVGGRVSTTGGLAIVGASVACTGTPAVPAVTTNSAGYFSFPAVQPGNYTLTPSKTGYRFTPATRAIAITTADLSALNFTGATGFNIAGRIATSGGIAVVGAKVLRSGSTVGVTTNSAGYYTLTDVPNGSIVLTPSMAGQSFTPETRTVTMAGADIANENFTAGAGYTVMGRIATSGGLAIVGVVVTRTGSSTTATTNSAGYFTFTAVPAGSYTLTPALAGKLFTPATKTVTVTNANVIAVNFTGA